MSQQIITLGFGKANFPATLATFACFRVRPPFLRDSAVTSGAQQRGQGSDYHAGAIDVHGTLYVRPVSHANGEILLFQSSWKRRGAPIRDGAIFLRLREGAAKWAIHAKLPMEPENRHGAQFKVFEGCADLLSADELMGFGLEAPRMYRQKFMSEEEVDECYVLEELQEERAARPNLLVVKDGDKTKVVEVASKPQRRLVFRR